MYTLTYKLEEFPLNVVQDGGKTFAVAMVDGEVEIEWYEDKFHDGPQIDEIDIYIDSPVDSKRHRLRDQDWTFDLIANEIRRLWEDGSIDPYNGERSTGPDMSHRLTARELGVGRAA